MTERASTKSKTPTSDKDRVYHTSNTPVKDLPRDKKRRGNPMFTADELNTRRELVFYLHTRGVSYGDIVRRIQKDPVLQHLLEGYRMPLFRVVMGDFKAYAKKRSQTITENDRDEALLEYADRMDTVFVEMFKKVMAEAGISAQDAETLMRTAMEAAKNKAAALGVDTEGAVVEPGPSGGPDMRGSQFLFSTPETFMQFMGQVDTAKRLQEPPKTVAEAAVAAEPIEGQVIEPTGS